MRVGEFVSFTGFFAIYALGALLGLAGGLASMWLADALPKRAKLTHLTTGPRRNRRNALVLGLAVLAGILLARMFTGAPDAPLGHAAFDVVTNLVVVAMLLAGAAIDIEHMTLPNELTLGGAAGAVVLAPFRSLGLTGALVGVAAALVVSILPSLLYKKLRGYEGAGLGDAKLVLFAGAWFGAPGAAFVLFAGAVQSTIAALFMRIGGLSFPIPESVKAELEELRERARAGDAEAIELLEGDVMAVTFTDEKASGEASSPGRSEREVGPRATRASFGTMRLPLGPFLVLACLEFLFFRTSILSIADHFLASR